MYELFGSCLNAEYTTVAGGGSYAFERDGDRLYIFFEPSDGISDWVNNLNYKPVLYDEMPFPWYCHGGFLNVWRSIRRYIAEAIASLAVREIIIVGYSHGAALALFCHEFVMYNRPDIAGNVNGFGFGCPLVYFGIPIEEHAAIWHNFRVVRNVDDLVTYLPPQILGFTVVGRLIEVGSAGRYSSLDAHRPENYLTTLKQYETPAPRRRRR